MKLLHTLKIIPFIILVLLASCVGTVQETSAPQNLQFKNPPTTFPFPGIVSARAISHNKIEIEFYPASGGSEISYKLFVNNSTVPLSIDPQSLLRVAAGKLLYTVDGLSADREYKLKLRAFNTETAAVSANENEAFARTFDNVTADFKGVSKLSLVPGDTDGAILIDWIAPTMSGVFTASAYDPVHYEVTLISEYGGIANLNNPMYFGTDKKVILVPTPPARATPLSNPNSVVIDGLAADTRYFVQVRAINALYQDYAEDPSVTSIPVNREMNTRFISIKTDNSGALFDFRQDNVILANAPGADAFDKIDIFWQPGTGSFTGYRVFVRKYDGVGDPSIDDKLTESTLVSMSTAGNYYSIAPSFTSKRVSGLDNYSYYQVKVALCKITSCPVQSTDPNGAIISDLKTIRVQPTLAPFSGINAIEPPGQYSERDVVKLRFDAPLIGNGFANQLEFYCVDPADHSRKVKFDGNNTLSSTGITNCNGLFLEGTPPPITSYTVQKVKGLVTDGTKQYCFAATPVITGFGPDIRLPNNAMIVRCSFPEVFPPSIAQFPGLKNSCSVSGTTGYVQWNLPTGGIYSGFKVFWKEKTGSSKFSFPHAIAGDPGYSSSPALTASDLNYTATGLIPGRTYQIGVLAIVDLDPPSADLFSEYNLNVFDCAVPLPLASFNGFTRIFAVGPKTDGRVPNDPGTKTTATSSHIYEALDSNGIPYEVAMDTPSVPNPVANFAAPPGRDFGTSLSAGFDGMPEGGFGYAISKEGIISLAWEDVSLSFPEAESMFASNMPASAAPRTGRTWGYKVFRSSDNKLTWQDLTLQNGNVYSMSYSYRNRPTSALITKKMAFFTDYSVKALPDVHDAATGRDIERARTYFYRIVPVFDGKALKYSSGTHHIVKVTLPSANMALVHRWMANRSHCLEYDKQPEIANNYSCPYNGIGARPKSIPYRVGDTKLDQEGDLLIDRYELGCRYTRGDKVSNPDVGASSFQLPAGSRRDSNDWNHFPLFRGYRTVSESEDMTTPFKGCTGETSNSRGATGTVDDYPTGFVAEYNKVLQGDCIGTHGINIAYTTCTGSQYTANEFTPYNISAPGLPSNNSSAEDCSMDTPSNPVVIQTRLMGPYAPNEILQSEFLAVFYNRYSTALTSNTYQPPVEGPTTGSLSGRRIINRSVLNGFASSQCTINLASIASDGYMRPRWISVNDLGTGNIRFKADYPALMEKTVNEITEVRAATTEPLTLFNGVEGDGTAASFKLPNSGLRNSPRYRGTTRLAKIFSSNAAKLPPIGRLNPEVAQAICSNYFVQTGVATDGGNFAPNMQPIPKRALRRPDSITASAWPEHFDTSSISAIEASSNDGSCNSSFKNVNGNGVSKGSNLGNRLSASSSLTGVPLVSGSSEFNLISSITEAQHSKKCISRFGIQDLVGNVSESNSERIYCDYSQDQIFFGAVTGTWAGGTGAVNQGASGPEFPFFNTDIEMYEWAILKSGTPNDGSNSTFELRFDDGSPTRTDLKPWIKISVDSGYCSIVDNNPAKRSGTIDYFKDVATGFWNPVYLPGGAVNTSMIERTQADQDAVFGWRNGDGRFLDFGPQGMAASFNTANTLALNLSGLTDTGTTAKSKYFNPLIGLPLKCAAGSCNDPLLNTPNDNTWITTSFLNNNVNPDAAVNDLPVITDFFVGNSQITHQGISDFQYPATGFNSVTVPSNPTVTMGIPRILQRMTVTDPVTMGNPRIVTKNFPTDFNPGDTLEYYRVRWDVPRDTSFGLNSGGKANMQSTGRYTASIVQASSLASGSNDFNSGSRCAVMINQDE